MSDRFTGPETPDDRLVLRCETGSILDTSPPGLTYLTAISDILVPARFETVIDGFPFKFRRGSEDSAHYGQIGVLLSVLGKDRELFFEEVAVDVMVFEELDSFQDLVALTAKSGELRYQDDVDRVVQAEGESLLEDRTVFVGLPTGDVLLEGLDYGEMVGGRIAIEVFYLSGGVLTGFQGT
jgi:hypothetical protein